MMKASKSSKKNTDEGSSSPSIPQFMTPLMREAIEFSDLTTLSLILGLKRKEAENVVIRYNEQLTGYKERHIFCTQETRELKREILEILSSYPVTKNGRDMVLTLTPSLNEEELRRRIRDIKESKELTELMGEENIKRIRETISKVEIERMSFGIPPLITTQRRGVEEQIRINYGDFVRVEFIDSMDKAKNLMREENIILLIGEEVRDEPGIINIEDPFALHEAYPEFEVNSFIAKKNCIEAMLGVLEFEEVKNFYLFKDISVGDLEEAVEIIGEIERSKEEIDFDEVIYEGEEEINKEANKIMKRGGGVEDFKNYLEEVLVNIASKLMLEEGEDKNILRESAYENLERGLPFEFSREKIEKLRKIYSRKVGERRYYKLRNFAKEIERYRDEVSSDIKLLFYFDFLLAVSQFSQDFSLNVAEINEGEGLGQVMGRNIFLVNEELRGGEEVKAISYSIGKTSLPIFGATPHPVAILTGANSGGKTCLLISLAASVILALLGLPVPAERAEIPLLPLYFYRRKAIKKTGSFEYSMRALSRIFMREGGKVVLIDELEALTEPGAMGRIIASMLNNLPKDTLAMVITHLIHEILPHISVEMEKVRIDGIESEGLDAHGNIIVDRQPMFNHIGSSTPELVIKRLLGGIRKEELRKVYEEIIKALEKERGDVVLSYKVDE